MPKPLPTAYYTARPRCPLCGHPKRRIKDTRHVTPEFTVRVCWCARPGCNGKWTEREIVADMKVVPIT